jgi:L-seryl-tRNA(Ser) seleniumtransferase
MRQSGAELREVGTTNKTRAADYGAAISERTAAILRVHPSNFRIEGFTERPALREIVALSRRFGVLVIEDLGSGNLLDFRTGIGDQGSGIGDQATSRSSPRPPAPVPWSPIPDLLDEPLVTESVEAGVDICCFSGDKLLGGPQAGIIIGRTDPLEKIRRHPLMRALRVDKLTYAALEGTLLEYASGRAVTQVPVARMFATAVDELQQRADTIAARVAGHQRLHVQILDGHSTLGGGSAPGMTIPSRLLALTVDGLSANSVETLLRQAEPPIIARIEQDRVVLDLRTIQPDEDEIVARALEGLAGAPGPE